MAQHSERGRLLVASRFRLSSIEKPTMSSHKVALLTKEASEHGIHSAAMKEIRDAFDLFDVDKSNSIDSEELGNIMRTVGINPTAEELAHYIAQADKDGDGKISYPEFVDLMTECKKLQSDADLRLAFDYYDATGEGYITATELQRQLNKLGMDCSQADAIAMIQACSGDVDARGRPRCSFEQFKLYLAI